MTGIDSWSTTPATNATADGGSVNWAEGQTPSSVNNTARQQAADVRSAFNDIAWFQYGTGDQGAGNLAVPAVYSSATAFTITGANVTAAYHAGRRVRAVGVSTGTIYGSISSSSYNGGNSTTTVNVTWDSTSQLANETLVVSLCQIPFTGYPLPQPTVLLSSFNGTNLAAAFAQVATVSLTPGRWRVSALVAVINTVSATYMNGAISTTSASNAGTTPGLTSISAPINAVSVGVLVFPVVDITVTTTTSYYFNVDGNGTGAAALAGFMRAEKL